MLYFNDVLDNAKIPTTKLLIMRHSPNETKLKKVLPWLAADHPDIFNAYQQTQSERGETSLSRAKYLASFIGMRPKTALFVGIFEVLGTYNETPAQFEAKKVNQELYKLGMSPGDEFTKRESHLVFDLKLMPTLQEYKGKLVIEWLGPELSFMRWADNNKNNFPIHAILEESSLNRLMPEWDEMNLTWDELKLIPDSWRQSLSQWRGIYYIHDSSDNKGYVGSAYGEMNILGRWKYYQKSGDGDNKHLKGRDPTNFKFSIIQRVSPDMEQKELIELESKWKKRLHTYYPEGLNDK